MTFNLVILTNLWSHLQELDYNEKEQHKSKETKQQTRQNPQPIKLMLQCKFLNNSTSMQKRQEVYNLELKTFSNAFKLVAFCAFLYRNIFFKANVKIIRVLGSLMVFIVLLWVFCSKLLNLTAVS